MSRELHQEPVVFERIARGESSPEEVRHAVRHLLARCPRCRETANGVRKELQDVWNYDDVFAKMDDLILTLSVPPREAVATAH